MPTIEPSLEQARGRKRRVEALDRELAQAVARIMALGGSIPPSSELAKKRAEREQSAAEMLETINKIQETGCVVKDIDLGLVDFPSLLEGEEVFLCWKLGEERVAHWHGIHEGFAGRKPLDETPPDNPPSSPPRVQ